MYILFYLALGEFYYKLLTCVLVLSFFFVVFNPLFAHGRTSQYGIFASNVLVTYFVSFCSLPKALKCYGPLKGLMKN
jgi:hypothetical protein